MTFTQPPVRYPDLFAPTMPTDRRHHDLSHPLFPARLADQNANGSKYYGLGEGQGGVYTRPGESRGEYRAPKSGK